MFLGEVPKTNVSMLNIVVMLKYVLITLQRCDRRGAVEIDMIPNEL
jgi:hypothetical protein